MRPLPFARSLTSKPVNIPVVERSVGLQADQLTLALLLVCCVVAVCVGSMMTSASLALVWSAGLLLAGAATYVFQKGTALSRIVLPLLLCASVALQIQVSMGALELHFGVFVTLAVVMVYRDMWPILACAAFFAVHHLLFDRLQAAGFNIYCTTQANLMQTLSHGAYVVVQTTIELVVIQRMRQAFQQGAELNQLVNQVDQPGHIALAVQATPVQTPVGLRLRTTLQRMDEAVHAVKQTVTHVHSASKEIAMGSADLSQRTEGASTSIEETLNATQHIQDLVTKTAESAARVNQVVQETAGNASVGQEAIDSLVAQMQVMKKQSERIAEIASVVDRLAFQTNLLALNAAVEAAHAGDKGRGFAVVAQEVGRLAQSSTKAALEIREVIQQTVQSAASGKQASEQVQATMQTLSQGIAITAQSMQVIVASSEQQKSGIAQINHAIAHLDDLTSQNAALAEQSSAAAQSLQEQMSQVNEHMAMFEVTH